MDEDLRNRLRGGGYRAGSMPERRPVTPSYSRPVTPQPAPSVPTVSAPQPIQSTPVAVQPRPAAPPQDVDMPIRTTPKAPSENILTAKDDMTWPFELPAQTKPKTTPMPHTKTFEPPKEIPKLKTKKPKTKRRKWPFVTAASIIVLAGLGGGGFWYWQQNTKSNAGTQKEVLGNKTAQQGTTDEQAAATGQTLRIMAVGDSIAYTSINNAAHHGDGYDYLPLMQSLKPVLEKGDVRFCSQASPSAGASMGVSGAPTFNAPAEFARGLFEVGCNTIGLASDHANDKDQAGIDAMLSGWAALKPLATAGINSAAEQQVRPAVFTVKGAKFALLSYTTSSAKAVGNGFGVNMYSEQLAKSQIDAVRKDVNFIIVSMHWGDDGKVDPTAQQEQIAQSLAAQNVDIILGSGAHVVQPVKVLSGQGNHQTLVWYGLGNFLNSQIPVESLIGGVAIMDVNPSNGQILNPRFMPTYMHYEWTAQEKQRQSATDVLARKNFQLLPLDKATDLLAKSQNNTTVKAQQDRLTSILNRNLKVPLVTSDKLD